uniref:C-type lectin domain-containing protein n=1 Tax=Labrus bergylta TaxID=56723 RepID=A0A3Q3MC86_9LABR
YLKFKLLHFLLIVIFLKALLETGFCSRPWIPYNGHCFYLNRTEKTWPEAQRDCRFRGGDLVSIHSVEDQTSTDELWIGLNDRKTEKLFDWVDHSTVSFTSWEFGEPAVSTDINDCVLIRGEVSSLIWIFTISLGNR